MNKIISKYKYILWDWNGTLLDDSWLAIDIINIMLGRRGLKQITIDDYKEIFGFPIYDFYLKVGFDFENELFEDIAEEFIEIYNKRRLEPKLHKNVEIVLNKVREAGLKQCILSATQKDSLKQIIEDRGLSEVFETLMGLDDNFAASKVDLGRKFVAECIASPIEILMIGDTEHDYEVAKAIGIDCLLISNGHQSEERLRNTGAPVISSLSDLITDKNT